MLNIVPSSETTEQTLEKCLHAGNDRIQFHFENTSIGYIEWGPDLQVKVMSKRAEEILGWTGQEYHFQQMNGYSQVFPADLPAVLKMVNDLISGVVERVHIQHRNINKQGNIIWCDWYNSVMKGENGKIISIISLVQDITVFKEAAEKAEKANHLYAFISQVNQKVVRIKDEKALFRNACEIALQFGKFQIAWIGLYNENEKKLVLADECGIPAADLTKFKSLAYKINDPWHRIQTTGKYYISNNTDIDSDHQLCNPFSASENIKSCMMLPIKKNGVVFGTFNLYSTIASFFQKDEIDLLEELTDDISFAIDMLASARKGKEAEAGMKESDIQREFEENNLRALINNTNDLFWSVDRAFNLITSNQAFDDMTRLMSNQTIKKGSSIFPTGFHPEVLARYKKSYQRAFDGETFTETEYTEKPFEIWSEISFYPIRNGKEIIGTACHSHDVTESKLAELERVRITNDLIQRNKNLEQFGYIISHNLRSPVANILGVTNIMNQPGLSIDEKNALTHGLHEAVTKLDNVVNDLTHVLQVKSENNWMKETIHFSELVENIKTSIHNLVKAGNISIIYNFKAIDEMYTVKSYLYSIFYNLISNSIKYRRQDTHSEIYISSVLNENKIELLFTDNGLGIDMEKRSGQIFGLYKRFHTNIEGKGMGLFMVKTQVETLGGKITLQSEVNKGTEFRIEFDK